MYASGAEHPLRRPCRRVLSEARAQRIDAVISAEVIQEILHRYLGLNRVQFAREFASAALDLFAPVLSVDHSTMLRISELVERYPGLPARDLVHVATCQDRGITTIISPDRHFDQVEGLRRVAPDDEPAVAALVRE